MIIDTDKVSNWAMTHLSLVIPAATGFLSWFAAGRWQAALTACQTALVVFYFCIAAVSGVVTALLVIGYLNKIGAFDSFKDDCRCHR